jgi:hypothetical protein
LGSNMGDRFGALRRAVTLLGSWNGIHVNHGNDVASLFESSVGAGRQAKMNCRSSANCTYPHR